MAKSYKQPASMEVSSFLDKPGSFHFMVKRIDEDPTGKDGGQLDGIKVEMTVRDGTDKSQIKREFNPILFNPSESHKDGGEFATKVHLRLADALGLFKPVAPGEEVEIDWTKAGGRQLVAHVKHGRAKEGQEPRLEIDGAHIYHVDDPEVATVPKDLPAISVLPAALRRISKDPANARNQKPVNGNGAGNGNGKAAANKAAAANGNGNGGSAGVVGNGAGAAALAAASETVDYNDL